MKDRAAKKKADKLFAAAEAEASPEERAKLRSELKAWGSRVVDLQQEVVRTYTLRMEKMSLLLIRWIAYHELAMEDYKSFHPDADPENELENLLKMSKELSDLRYEDMREYHDKLVNFFGFIRGKVLKVTKGDKIVTEFIMSHDEIDKLDEKINKIDELRKKVP